MVGVFASDAQLSQLFLEEYVVSFLRRDLCTSGTSEPMSLDWATVIPYEIE